jgi:hypothetical protein
VLGVPLDVHWSAPLVAFVCGGFSLAPLRWGGVLGLLLAHELGHAIAVKAVGARVIGIELAGLGGRCTWSGHVSPLGRSTIAFAGVWAQLLLLVGELIAETLYGARWSASTRMDLGGIFVLYNFAMVMVNLLPIDPLDGAEAWPWFPRLFRHLWQSFQRRARKRRAPRQRRPLS